MTSRLPGWLPPRRLLYVIAGLVAALIAARVLLDSSSELGEAADSLDRVRWEWIVVAVVAELLSYVAFGRAMQRLLPLADRKPLVSLTAAAITAQAASQCIPGGAATSGIVAYRQVRRLGVDEVPSAAAIVVANVLQAAVLPLLALIGAELPGAADPIPGLRAVSIGLLVAIVVAGVLLVAFRSREWPRRSLVWTVLTFNSWGNWLRRRVFRQKVAAPGESGSALVGRLDDLDVGGGQIALAAVLCILFWAGDALCLAASFPAIGAGVPWRGLLLAYPAAQLVSALPIVPGGLGIVEGSLTAGLVAYGGATETALAAVLLYRLISFWGLTGLGGLTWLGLRTKYPLAVEEPLPRRWQREDDLPDLYDGCAARGGVRRDT